MDGHLDHEALECSCDGDPVTVTDGETGEMACTNCGTVLVSRAEMPHTTDNVSMLGNNVSAVKHRGSARMRRAMRLSQNVDHYGLAVQSAIVSCCSKLGLPAVVRYRAQAIFQKFRLDLKGRRSNVKASAALYMACREHSVPRSLDEICHTMDSGVKAARKAYKVLYEARGNLLPEQLYVGFSTRLSANLNLPGKTSRKALSILNRSREMGMFVGRRPILLAACSAYVAIMDDGLHITQNAIAAAAGVTAPGMKDVVHLMKKHLDSFNLG